MRVRKIRLTIEYDPDWTDIYHSEIPAALDEERRQWMNGEVDLQDLEGSGTAYTVKMEVVP